MIIVMQIIINVRALGVLRCFFFYFCVCERAFLFCSFWFWFLCHNANGSCFRRSERKNSHSIEQKKKQRESELSLNYDLRIWYYFTFYFILCYYTTLLVLFLRILFAITPVVIVLGTALNIFCWLSWLAIASVFNVHLSISTKTNIE